VDKKEQQRWLNLPFTGCDGQPATGQAWVRDGQLPDDFHPPFAGQAIEILGQSDQRRNAATGTSHDHFSLHPIPRHAEAAQS